MPERSGVPAGPDVPAGRRSRVHVQVRRAAFALVAVFALGVARAGAEPVACERAIARESAHYAQAAMHALWSCGDKVLARHLPAATDCRTEPATGAKIAAAAAKAGTRTAAKCCGADRTCGTAGDESLAMIGWGFGSCPDLESGPCTGAIGTPGDAAPCATCVGDVAVDRLLGVVWGPAGPVPGSAPACRRALAKETAKLFVARSKALARCWDGRLAGRHANDCPTPGDGKAAGAIAAAETKATARICAACGGPDRACGGADDPPPAALGLAADCPASTVPGGATCGGPLATLSDVTSCALCVAAFAGTCADRVGVPAVAPYPAECDPGAPVCASGVECAADADCPLGYTCQDNGGGTRYCVGAPCAGTTCSGGGVCRPYCTFDGCSAPQCQCPGFGCAGADQVCLDQGGLACNKLCTQDSDCVAPFGFVCVNAGFADGICIGTVPCQ